MKETFEIDENYQKDISALPRPTDLAAHHQDGADAAMQDAPTPLHPRDLVLLRLRTLLTTMGNLDPTDTEFFEEFYRPGEVWAVEEALQAACKQEGLSTPRQIFQRFLFGSRTAEAHEGIGNDPILPLRGEKSNELRRGLIEVLEKYKGKQKPESEEIADRVCQAAGQAARESKARLQSSVEQALAASPEGAGPVTVNILRDQVQLGYGETQHTLNVSHYTKFYQLFSQSTLRVLREAEEEENAALRARAKERRKRFGEDKDDKPEETPQMELEKEGSAGEEKEDRKDGEDDGRDSDPWRRRGMRADRARDEDEKDEEEEEVHGTAWKEMTEKEAELFHKRLFILLQRYNCVGKSDTAAGGSGFHAALTEQVFQFLHDKFGIEMECFASPFNAHYGSFCSAFEDTDRWFGSFGSFFDFSPAAGSYEWNPPYLEDLMEDGAKRLLRLLQESKEPLSFFIVLPNWEVPPTPSIEMLAGAPFEPFRQADVIQPKGKDQWLDGFQHNGRPRHFVAPWDGRIFFVQNEAGKARWPIDDEKIKLLLRVFQEGYSRESGEVAPKRKSVFDRLETNPKRKR